MNEFLFLLDGLMKVALCTGILVLVATAPSLAAGSVQADQAPADPLPPHSWTALHISEDLAFPWTTSFQADRAGHASPLGMDPDLLLETDYYEFDDSSQRSSRIFGNEDYGFDWAEEQPLVNLDGTPMNGFTDLNGNPFGVSTCDHDLWD